MATRTPLAVKDTLAELRQKLKDASDAAHKTRIRAIIHTKRGHTRKEVALTFSISYDSVGDWVKKYNEGGTDALTTNLGGRPEGNPIWDTSIFDALATEIDRGGRYWSIPLMQDWIREKYKKEIPENTIWNHVTDLDYSYKSARPHPYKGDTEEQHAFKKRALFRY